MIKKSIAVILLSFCLLPAFGKFCSECGLSVVNTAKFCSECGSSVASNTASLKTKEVSIWEELEIINEWEKFLESANYQTAAAAYPEHKIKIDKIMRARLDSFSSLSPVESKYLEVMNTKWVSIQGRLKAWSDKIFGKADVKTMGEKTYELELAIAPIRNRMIKFLVDRKDENGILPKFANLRDRCSNRIVPVIVSKKLSATESSPGSRNGKFNIMPSQQLFVLAISETGTASVLNISLGFQNWQSAVVSIADLEAASFWKRESMDPFYGF